MNDEHSGQLCTNTYKIPAYAQGKLFLQTEAEIVPTEGEYGLFDLSVPAPLLRLHWGEVGPGLVCLPWQTDTLAWDGLIRVGGHINAMHLLYVNNTAYITVYLGGKPLDYTRPSLPVSTDAHFHDGLSVGIPETITTWLLPQSRRFTALMHEPLMQNLRLHVEGRLIPNNHPLLDHFELPLMMENAIVFAP